MNSFMFFARKLALGLMLALAVPAFGGAAALVSAGIAHAAVASSIQVKGNQRIEAATVKTYLTIKAGKSYDGADIDASVKALYATGLFSDVGITQRGSVLVVTRGREPDHQFGGLRGQQEDQVGRSGADRRAQAARRADRRQAQGRHLPHQGILPDQGPQQRRGRRADHASCPTTASTSSSPSTRASAPASAAIHFVGNRAFSSQRLSGIISTKKTNWLSWLTQNDIYSEDKLNADADLLRAFYLKHGYADFQVLSQDATFDAAKGNYAITFTLDEGPKYKFGDVNIDSSIQGVDTNALAEDRQDEERPHVRFDQDREVDRGPDHRAVAARLRVRRRCARAATATTATTPST